MKNKIIKTSLLVLSLFVTGCGNVSHYEDHLDDYAFTMDYHNKFNVLQLTDIHWNLNTSDSSSKQYLHKVIKEAKDYVLKTQSNEAKIDLIEITGDTFMLSNSDYVKSFVNFMEEEAKEYDFKYTILWGNHDRQGTYNPTWLANQFINAEHCIYTEPNDDLYGRSNLVINLKDKDNNTKWQIANLDSGASFSDSSASIARNYDYIRDDQVNWLKKEHDLVGSSVPVIAYYHIPSPEMKTIYNEVVNGASYKNKFFKLESFAEQEAPSKFLTEAEKMNVKATFSGHAHNVDWTVEYHNMVLGLGVKTGKELYFAHVDVNDETKEVQDGLTSVGLNENFDLIGASLVTLRDNEEFDLSHLYLNERDNEDFVRWVKF